MENNETPYEERKAAEEKQLTIDLLTRLDDRLKNAHYWMTERDAQKQAEGAIMEARGLTLRLSEKYGVYIQFPSANVKSAGTDASEKTL